MGPTDNPLLGTWHLVRWDITYSDGRPASLPFGADAHGMICYTHDGSMSACIANANRPRLTSESARTAPVEERLAAFETFFHYAGRYHLQTVEGQLRVVHWVTHALNPNFVGSQQVRDVAFAEDGGLTLSASDNVPGTNVARHHRLVWHRRDVAIAPRP